MEAENLSKTLGKVAQTSGFRPHLVENEQTKWDPFIIHRCFLKKIFSFSLIYQVCWNHSLLITVFCLNNKRLTR